LIHNAGIGITIIIGYQHNAQTRQTTLRKVIHFQQTRVVV
jgi:hypothetical protein